jgi:hypothetical protein
MKKVLSIGFLSVVLTGCITTRVSDLPPCAAELASFYGEAAKKDAPVAPPFVSPLMQVHQYLDSDKSVHSLCFISSMLQRSKVGCGVVGDIIGLCKMQSSLIMYYGYGVKSLTQQQKDKEKQQEEKSLPL